LQDVDKTLPRELYGEAGNIADVTTHLIPCLFACIYVYIKFYCLVQAKKQSIFCRGQIIFKPQNIHVEELR
jgi:hypothetical protein